jgi:hypothetical protein
MKTDKAIEAFDAHLEDAQRIAAELLVVLVHRVGWSDDEIDWTKVEPMMRIHDQLEQIQQTVEAATGNRRPPLPVQPLTCKNAMVHGKDSLVKTAAPVSRRWFSEQTRQDWKPTTNNKEKK